MTTDVSNGEDSIFGFVNGEADLRTETLRSGCRFRNYSGSTHVTIDNHLRAGEAEVKNQYLRIRIRGWSTPIAPSSAKVGIG
jgi:hypothetical protein